MSKRENIKAILVVEMSLGQMVDDVRLAVDGQKPVKFLGRTGGAIPTVAEIVSATKQTLREVM